MAAPDIRHSADRTDVEFDDNLKVMELYGPDHRHLVLLEGRLSVRLADRGNLLSVTGGEDERIIAVRVLDLLWTVLEQGHEIGPSEIDSAIVTAQRESAPQTPAVAAAAEDTAAQTAMDGGTGVLRVGKKTVRARSANQALYFDALARNELVFGLGPAGTGKTYLAVAFAAQLLASDRVKRVILSRPAVEAGEKLGFLPGDMKEKVDPYLRPLYDALQDLLPADKVARWMENGTIEIAPLAFMRGRTLSNAVIILDEAQNTTTTQMKMFLTRLGEGSRMVITGDQSQVDLPRGVSSGLRDAERILKGVEGVSFIRFNRADVVRHPLVTRIVEAYEAAEGPELDLSRR